MCVFSYRYINTHTYAHIYRYIHRYIYAHIYMHIHIYTVNPRILAHGF